MLSSNDSANATSDSSSSPYIDRILPSVVAMVILFVLSALGNVTVFLALVTSRCVVVMLMYDVLQSRSVSYVQKRRIFLKNILSRHSGSYPAVVVWD